MADHAGAIPDDVYAHLLDLARGSGRAFLGPRSPTPGTIGYHDAWQLTVGRDRSAIAGRREKVMVLVDRDILSTSYYRVYSKIEP